MSKNSSFSGFFFLDFWDRSDPKVLVPITKLWYPKRNWVEIFFARTGGLQLPLAAGVLFLYFRSVVPPSRLHAKFWGIFFSKFLYVRDFPEYRGTIAHA